MLLFSSSLLELVLTFLVLGVACPRLCAVWTVFFIILDLFVYLLYTTSISFGDGKLILSYNIHSDHPLDSLKILVLKFLWFGCSL